MLVDLGTISPLWIVGLGAALVLLLTVAGGRAQLSPPSSHHLVVLTLLVLGAALWLLLGHEGASSAFSGALLVDGVGVVFGIVALVGALLAATLSTGYLTEHELSQGEFLALLLLSTVGMLMLTMAGDLITLFIGLETMSLAVYVLAGYRRSSRRSQEAALKYFVYGAFASGFLLFGIALLYGEVGRLTGHPSVMLSALGAAIEAGEVSRLGFVGIAFVLSGFAFKVAAVPFHMWAPDVYEGAPTPATAFMAVGVKAAAFAGLCRFAAAALLHGGVATETTIQLFEVLAIVTMVYGNLLAIRQTQIKRMLAYSSIAHAGYVLVGVAAFLAHPQGAAMEGIAYYLLGYTAMTLGAFGIVLAFERRDDRRLDITIDRFAGIGREHPALGLAMALFMFSLAGVPPTAGFFGKLAVFAAAVEAGRVAVVIVAVLASAVGAYYYLRVTVVMFMRPRVSEEQRVRSAWLSAGVFGAATLVLVVGILPDGALSFARRLLAGWLS
ncbi:MAG: NADH-quinone oxidoreductase subunit N [Myxococcota bacterium]